MNIASTGIGHQVNGTFETKDVADASTSIDGPLNDMIKHTSTRALPLDAAATPADTAPGSSESNPANMDLTPFELQLPTGTPGRVDHVSGSELNDYNSEYFQHGTDAINFFTPVDGVTTENGSSARTELAQQDSWTLESGPHSLTATLSVDQVPSEGEVTIGQIHQRVDGADNPGPPVILVYEDGKIVAQVKDANTESAERQNIVIAENIELGEKFTYSINTDPSGILTISAAGQSTSMNLDPSFNGADLHFKAGVYMDDNEGVSPEGGRISLYDLDMT